jgi:ABC-type dipeptide/oligopeptide/nickel transport system ATPase component
MTRLESVPTPPASRRPSPLLEIDDLAVSFEMSATDRVQAVDGLALTVHPRQTVAVVGESGCGKSVTALSILRLVPRPPGRIDRGRILFRGRDLLACSEQEMLGIRGGEIAMIFQEPVTSLNPVFTIGDQIIEAILLHQQVDRRRARELALQAMHEVGIERPEQNLRAYPHELSGGMCQRAMTAMALACQPRLLLADEPTTALDMTIQAQILELLARLQGASGMSILLISHDLGVVAEVADVVCVMYAGRVMEYAAVGELFDKPLHPYTRGLFSSIPRLDRRRHRLLTVNEVLADAGQFRTLPGYRYGIVPWWPTARPPDELDDGRPAGDRYHLFEVEPGHWVGCWRTAYVADHPPTRPDLDARRRRPGDDPV